MRCFLFFSVILSALVSFSHSLSIPPSASSRGPVSFVAAAKLSRDLLQEKLTERVSDRRAPMAMAIPGNGILETTVIGGTGTFLTLYNYVVTLRVLLSWFPQAQSISILSPVYTVTDPFLNTFRGLVPAVAGIDFSPLLGFFLLNALTSATAAVGADLNEANCDNTKKAFQL